MNEHINIIKISACLSYWDNFNKELYKRIIFLKARKLLVELDKIMP